MSFSTPILFLVFNRPDTTNRVFDELRKLKPLHLYVAADGPRAHVSTDKIKCDQVRQIVESVDWPCEIRTLFRDHNLGCKMAVSSAITWFFDQVEEGIILEDDCLPSQGFFHYCAELLRLYRYDSRVMQISGTNLLGEFHQSTDSYFFSNYGPIWGWATWRRFWKLYDVNIKTWEKVKSLGLYYSIAQSQREAELRYKLFEKLYNNQIDTWDFQVVYARMLNNGLAIIPATNLITNIGFGPDATHTTGVDVRANMNSFEMDFPMQHPFFVIQNFHFDRLYADKFILGVDSTPEARSFADRLINKVKRMVDKTLIPNKQ